MPAGQKRAPHLITDDCEPPCGCWELNSGHLEEQAMLLTIEPFLQPPYLIVLVHIASKWTLEKPSEGDCFH